jgi:hypothetical protein
MLLVSLLLQHRTHAFAGTFAGTPLKQAVLRICKFYGLLDPDPDSSDRCTDPARILLSAIKNSKKILDSYSIVTS